MEKLSTRVEAKSTPDEADSSGFHTARCGMRVIPWFEVVLFAAILGFAINDHLLDHAMRSAILAERGVGYFVGLIAAGILPVAIGVTGLI